MAHIGQSRQDSGLGVPGTAGRFGSDFVMGPVQTLDTSGLGCLVWARFARNLALAEMYVPYGVWVQGVGFGQQGVGCGA